MSKGGIAAGQDWKPQTFNFAPRPSSGGVSKNLTESQANRALQVGGAVEIQKKEHLNFNKHNTGPGANAKKLDEDNETLKVKHVDHGLSINIQRARQAKNWTQADLAKEICEKASIVTDYENGKAIPVEGVLLRMEKALGVHLRGVKAGQPMEAKKFKTKPA
jgi:putative transcription factor